MARFTSARYQAYSDMRALERDEKLVSTGKVWNPGNRPPQKRVFKGQQRAHIVAMVGETLSHWTSSPFEHEGAARAAVRSALCLDAIGWDQSDYEAATIVAEGLASKGARRPTWDEGQREYVEPRDTCAWCGGGVPEDLLVGNHRTRFCSSVCARSAITHRDLAQTRSEGKAYDAAMDIIIRARNPAIDCKECGKAFRPSKDGQKFCSHGCSVTADTLPDQPCEHCGTLFHPKVAATKYCSQHCSGAARRKNFIRVCACCGDVYQPTNNHRVYCSKRCTDEAKRQMRLEASCSFCGTSFEARSPKAMFCCMACAAASSKQRRGWTPRELAPHIFDHYLTMPINASRPAWLTPERFDDLVAA